MATDRNAAIGNWSEFFNIAEHSFGMKSLFASNFYLTRVRSLGMLVTNSLTDSLPNSCLVNLIDVTLTCEDTNSKLVDIVTVADVDDEDCIGNSLLQIYELRIFHKAKLLFRL